MKNITVSITDETYRQARMWAAEHNTSVSAAVQYMLENVHRILRVHKPPPRVRHTTTPTTPPQKPKSDSEAVNRILKRVNSMLYGQ
jgi:hypothetical protein